MSLTIGFALCGSFCTLSRAVSVLRALAERDFRLIPIMSRAVYETDTRFGQARAWRETVEDICGRAVIATIPEAEPLGPAAPLDALVVCPCTGNTLAKLANGITDTPVTMAVKAHLRQDRPVLLAPATNDALSGNLGNVARLMSRKSVFFVPMVQDDPAAKPHSLVADFDRVPEALAAALAGEQLRKVFV